MIGGYGLRLVYGQSISDTNSFYNVDFKHADLWLTYTNSPHKLVCMFYSLMIGWGSIDFSGSDSIGANEFN